MDRETLITNLDRWMFASISDHFINKMPTLDVVVEGHDRSQETFTKDLVEFRCDGPVIQEKGRNEYYIKTEVNCLIQSVMRDTSTHVLYTDVGLVLKAFTKGIPVYRYGLGADDDQSMLGCLELIQEKRERLDVTHLGRVGIDSPIVRANVEGHYCMDILLKE